MKRPAFSRSLRFKLVVASVIVEAIMLTALVANSVRLMQSHLIDQAELRLTELEPLLNASLAAALAQRDFGTMDDVLKQVRRDDGVTYLVLLDSSGKRVAAEGWPADVDLPPLDRRIDELARGDQVFDTEIPIRLAGQTYGLLRFGISTDFLTSARSSIVRQGALIALAEIILSFALLAALGYWLTRHLALLARATNDVAEGNFNVSLPVHSEDEVGQLTRNFNLMADAVRTRVEELSANEAKFHAIADYTYDWESWFNPDGRLIWVNPSVERLTGYTPDECLEMDHFPISLVYPDDAPRVREEFQLALRGTAGSDFEFRVLRKEGRIVWVAANWQPIFGASGRFLGIRSGIRDITERKEGELVLQSSIAELRSSEEMQRRYRSEAENEQSRLVSLLAAMNLGILFVGTDNRVIYYNPAFLRIWLIPDELDLAGKPVSDILTYSENELARPDHFSKHILNVLETHEVSDTFEIHMADGRVVTQLAYPVRDREGRFTGMLWIYEDVTRERQTAEQLIYLAERDSLTGLFNRRRFQEELERMLADVDRYGSQGALIFFDLDEFKYINDTFGHRAGDAMLIRVASEVGALVRRNEIFSRLGGDEFALLVPDVQESDIEVLAERIIRAISQIPFRFEGHNLRLTASVGIALYPKHAINTDELVAHADAAMYQAKEAGKNAWRIYRQDLDASREMVNRLSWNDRISRALESDLFQLHFQGIYNADTGAIAHLEALVRMTDEKYTGRLIMPGHFIPFAEKSGKIQEIDRWVIQEAIRTLARAPDIPPIAVNISGRSFDAPTLPQFISECLAYYQVEPNRLMVELTETAAISDLQDAERFIEALHQTGCRICLDDFGTGFSSFAYLKHLDADYLKIDGLFIRNLPNDRDNQVFVKAIVDVARGMKKIVVAEFVEDAATLKMLKNFGVHLVQGYHLDTPRLDHPALNPGA